MRGAYNRYCADFARADPQRLKPVMLVPFNHPEVAAREIAYAREVCGLEVAFVNRRHPTRCRGAILATTLSGRPSRIST